MAEMVIFDVVEAILLRCVVKDVLRCKSVCKSWYFLISTPSFVKTHRKFICNKEEYNISRRIAMINPWVSRSSCRSSLPIEWRDYTKWLLAGSSNGLVALFLEPRICVTNPLTRVFRVFENLPKLPEAVSFQLCLGFGYDSCGDDYKLVMAITKGTDRAVVHVLSLKSSIWKHLVVSYRFHDGALAKPGIFFNGALHWFWFDAIDTTHNKVLLVSFDLATDEFREIPQPNDAGYVWSFYSTLGVIKGRLCIFHKRREDGLPYDIWVMKNYNSWELLPNDCEIKDHAIHYMLKDTIQSSVLPTYYCDDNTQSSRDAQFIESPIFVRTLVSPYLNRNGRPRRQKNNKSTFSTRRPDVTENNESTLSNGRHMSTISTGRPSLTENNKGAVDNARCPSHPKNNESTIDNTAAPNRPKNSTFNNARSLSHPKNNESTVDNNATLSHPKNSTTNNDRSLSQPKNNESTLDNIASPIHPKNSTISSARSLSNTQNNESTFDNTLTPSHLKNSTIDDARTPSQPKNNESTLDSTASPSHLKNSTINNARSPSRPKSNESIVKAALSVKEKGEIEVVYCMEDRDVEEEEECGNKKNGFNEKRSVQIHLEEGESGIRTSQRMNK